MMIREKIEDIMLEAIKNQDSITEASQRILDLFNVSISAHSMLKEILDECPYVFDYTTIPKSKDMSSPQICGAISIAYKRYQKAQDIISDEC